MEPKELCDLRTCFTENFGIEKVIVNVLANPNINCLIVCGEESEHLVGESIISLAENGDKDPVTIQKAINSCTTPARSEAYVASILDRFSSSKYFPLSKTLKTSNYY